MPRIKTVSNRSPKRSRREKGSTSQAPTHTPSHDTLGITFPTRESANRFAYLSARQILPTKFADIDALNALGVTHGVRTLLGRIWCAELLDVYAPTYRRLTLEVLSTFTCSMRHRLMKFRAYGRECEIRFDDVGILFGCSPGNEGETIAIDSEYASLFSSIAAWNRITGLTDAYNPRLAKGSSILHPCLRIAHRLLTSTIFCRSDSGTVLHLELCLLDSMTEQTYTSLDGGAFIALKLLRSAEATSGEICCGGLITYLVTRSALQIPISEDDVVVDGLDRLNLIAFRRMHFISPQDGRYSWLVGPQHAHHSFLPDMARTQIGDDTNWLFPPREEEGREEISTHHRTHLMTKALILMRALMP